MIKMPPVSYDVVEIKGGWDTDTPTLSLAPGVARDCLNFEMAVSGGASRIGGYERLDGRTSPSDATFTIVQVTSFTNTPTTGQTLAGTSGGAHSGVIIVVGANYMAITKVSGSFVVGETVTVGATTIGVVAATSVSITAEERAQYINLAADNYRADIGAVPGSGPVRGVVTYNDVKYAFRDNAGATACEMYKSSASGWVKVDFEYEIGFSNANTSVGDGDTLTQGGVTATIRRVMVQTGTLVSGTNTGRLVISVTAGGNFAAGAATSTGGGALTLSAIQTAITMAVGGKFEFDIANFFGQASGLRLYGCDGGNRMFEFDGTYFCPIATGVTPDTPKHLAAFKNHLFASVQSSAFHSGIGAPYAWTAVLGGSEIPTGDTVTGFKVLPGAQTASAMMIGGSKNAFILYGTSVANWNFVTYAQGVGVLDYSIQHLTETYFLGNRGVVGLQASQAYGNFAQATLTNSIKAFIKQKRLRVAYSTLSRERSQYRILFTDGYALYVTIVNGKTLGAMQVQFESAAYCAHAGETNAGDEVLLFGAASGGYVYQMDKGSSFDGAAILTKLVFNFNSSKSPRTIKRYRKASVEMQATSYVAMRFGYSFAYASTYEIQPASTAHTSSLTTASYDSGVSWDQAGIYWDGQSIGPTEVDMVGNGENVQITISSGTDYLLPFTLNSYILHYSPRRGLR